ncbi:hypothetical protein D3C79_760500 [compost metagenome]
MGQQFFAGAGFAEQQHRRITTGATPSTALGLKAGSTGADELGKAVLGLTGAQLRAGRRQFLLHTGVALEQR